MLGGGVRGQYRINRAASWNAATASSQRRPEQPSQAAHPSGAAASHVSNSRLPQQRPRGLPSAAAAVHAAEAPSQAERPRQQRSSDPRAFHASDLAFQEPTPTKAAKPAAKQVPRYDTMHAEPMRTCFMKTAEAAPWMGNLQIATWS